MCDRETGCELLVKRHCEAFLGEAAWTRGHAMSVLLAVASLFIGDTSVAFVRSAAWADTLDWALVQAYQHNPSLNAQRASLRASDKNVPQALSGYRPQLSLTATGRHNYQSSTSVFPLGGALVTSPFGQNFYSRTIGAVSSLVERPRRFADGDGVDDRFGATDFPARARRSPIAWLRHLRRRRSGARLDR
jgi:hypothetical protein